MNTNARTTRLVGLLALATAMLASQAEAQRGRRGVQRGAGVEEPARARPAGGGSVRSEALARGRYAVVIDLDHNRLHFRQGEHTLWSAPIGTGSGLRMKDDDQAWDFSTPNGVYHVKYKERDPVWIAEDWYFVENGLPIPPRNDPKRYFPGGLGAAAVYIDRDLAIHGTDKTDLLGQRVSHGCIRLSNRDALRLYHNVQVGTEVIIVGGERAPRDEITPAEARALAARFKPANAKKAPKDPQVARWERMPVAELAMVLESELNEVPARSRWTEVAHILSDRALKGDNRAMEALLEIALELPSAAAEREYRTYLADAYSRGGVRLLSALSQMDSRDREVVAEMIVVATMGLYHGELDESTAPWPTRRVSQQAAGRAGRRGWEAVHEAEERLGRRLNRPST